MMDDAVKLRRFEADTERRLARTERGLHKTVVTARKGRYNMRYEESWCLAETWNYRYGIRLYTVNLKVLR